MRRISLAALSLLALSVLSCSSGGDEGPTGPGPMTRNLVIAFTVDNAAGVQTITGARLLFDGRLIDRYQGSALRSAGFNIAVERVTPGEHTVGISVEHAAQSAVLYRTGGAGATALNTVTVTNATGPAIAVINLPKDVVALASGQVHEHRFQVP
ncbi:MAG TPA: hypothetical protein VEG34_09575 [Thermoanaerobaculia bacterium]|nr:hypothetical protein [Thermoanaerobaculia bacterium]